MSAMASGAKWLSFPNGNYFAGNGPQNESAFDRARSHFIALVAEGAHLKSQQVYEYLCEVGQF